MRLIFMYVRLLRNLTLLARIAILLSTLAFPICLELLDGLPVTGLCPSCVHWGRLILYMVMSQVAMAVIALSSRVDQTRIKMELDRRTTELDREIHALREDHELKITGTQHRVRDLDAWVSNLRQAIGEELGIELPGRIVSGWGDGARVEVTIGAAVGTVTLSSKKTGRIRSWFIRQARRFWGWFQKWVLAKDFDWS